MMTLVELLQDKFDAMYEYEEVAIEVQPNGDRQIIFKNDYCMLYVNVEYRNSIVNFKSAYVNGGYCGIEEVYDVAYSLKLMYEVLNEFNGASIVFK